MDSCTVIRFLQNYIQHKRIGLGSEEHFSKLGLNSPNFVLIVAQKLCDVAALIAIQAGRVKSHVFWQLKTQTTTN